MFAIAFDMVISDLKKYYSAISHTQAYYEISKCCPNMDFTERKEASI